MGTPLLSLLPFSDGASVPKHCSGPALRLWVGVEGFRISTEQGPTAMRPGKQPWLMIQFHC